MSLNLRAVQLEGHDNHFNRYLCDKFMERRIDHYLERLISSDSMTFYKALCEFAEERIEPNYLDWERNHQLIPEDVISEMGLLAATWLNHLPNSIH